MIVKKELGSLYPVEISGYELGTENLNLQVKILKILGMAKFFPTLTIFLT